MPGRQWKISAEQLKKIKRLKKDGMSNDALMERFSLTRRQLGDLLYREPRGKNG